MREILFRAKGENGEWLYGYPSIATDDCDNLCYFTVYEEETGYFIRHIASIDTLGQYTGLTDKNGTNIFEGDIVKRQWGDYPFQYVLYVVKFSFGEFELEAINTKGKVFIAYHYECEVIGNIHDNPELLKEGETE